MAAGETGDAMGRHAQAEAVDSIEHAADPAVAEAFTALVLKRATDTQAGPRHVFGEGPCECRGADCRRAALRIT